MCVQVVQDVCGLVAHNARQRVIPLEEVSAIEKRNSSMVLPNAIQIYTRTNKVTMMHGRSCPRITLHHSRCAQEHCS